MLSARGRGGKIRAPKKGVSKDEVDVDATWKILEDAFADIHAKNASSLSYETLFRNAYKLVLKKKQDVLYDRVCGFEQAYLGSVVREQVAAAATSTLLVGLGGNNAAVAADSQANQRRIDGENFLRAVKTAFQDEQLSMGMITDVLIYMERIMMQDTHRPSIYVAVMDLFRRHVLQAPVRDDTAFTALDLLEATILDMIQMERHGELIDRGLVRACCHVLEGLYESVAEDESTKLYLTSFEPKFLDVSRRFYHQEGLDLVAQADASTFCGHARRRLREEEERCQQTLAAVSDAKIRAVVEHELIATHIKDVINMEGTGVKSMLDNDRLGDLANIYELVSKIDRRKTHLKAALHKRVTELGAEINKAASITFNTAPEKKAPPKPAEPKEAKNAKDAKNPAERNLSHQTQAAILWVEQILELKAKYDRIWERAFDKDPVIEKALEAAFQDFINLNERSSEYVSLFLDEYLKRGAKAVSELDVDAMLDRGILLLQYLANTDLFETYYRKHLAKRLLMKKTVSRDVERQMLSKMKMKIGNHVTTKLEGMIKDTDTSDNLAAQYKEYVRNLGDADPKRIELDARILTTNQWPFELLSRNDDQGSYRTCNFPPAIERTKMRFEKFYHEKHTGRKLTWMPNLGDADVRATFKGTEGKTRRYELNMSTHCMVVVMLFNDLEAGQSLTFEQIEAETSIPRPDLIKSLGALSLVPKWRVLKKEPQSKEILASDHFYFNEGFSSPFVKIKIASISSFGSSRVENTEERRATQRRVDDERGHVVEAAIVRIMKQRKTLSHQQLMSETLQQLSARFQPDVSMIKRKIEALIDREYLERGPDEDKPSYNYLA
ncbi:hypothetical protein DV738_g1402, partial [Chaetothyriales sp. CBS 135597]